MGIIIFKLISDNTLDNTRVSLYIISRQFMKYPFYPLLSSFSYYNLLKYLESIGTVNFREVIN